MTASWLYWRSAMIQNLIFDVGDTLTMHRHDREWSKRRLAEEYSVPLERIKDFWREFLTAGDAVGGVTLREFWPKKKTNLGPIPLEAVERAAQRHTDDKVVNPAMAELLEALKPRYRLFALTNVWKEGHPHRRVLEPWFEAFVQSTEIGTRKPEPSAYLHVLETYGLKPEETLFIDNHEPHVEGARAVGLHALQFTTVEQLKHDLARLGVIVS